MTKSLKIKLRIIIVSLMALSALTLAAYPFWPLASYYVRGSEGLELSAPVPYENGEQVILGDRLIIPKIGVDMEIIGGNDEEYAWSKGAWIDPSTSTPDEGSNTAFSAHRFKYLPPSSKTFYLLDKLSIGDEILVYWNDKKYTYSVSSSYIVPPTAIEVLEPTDDSLITLITCDPLFSVKNRLIVRAQLVKTVAINK